MYLRLSPHFLNGRQLTSKQLMRLLLLDYGVLMTSMMSIYDPMFSEIPDPVPDLIKSCAVFITESNLSHIVNKVNLQDVNPLVGELYKRKLYLFSPLETRKLQLIRQVLCDPVVFIEHFFKKHYRPFKRELLFPPGPPCWHRSPKCPSLNSEFQNYIIPVEILSRGPEVVDEFRVWAVENIALLEENPDLFRVKLSAKFRVRGSQLEKLKLPNSGPAFFDDLNLEGVEIKIDGLLTELNRYYEASSDHRQLVDFWSNKTDMRRSPGKLYAYKKSPCFQGREKSLLQFMEMFDQTFKTPLRKLLITWYRIQYNPDLHFDNRLLSQLGFRACCNPRC